MPNPARRDGAAVVHSMASSDGSAGSDSVQRPLRTSGAAHDAVVVTELPAELDSDASRLQSTSGTIRGSAVSRDSVASISNDRGG